MPSHPNRGARTAASKLNPAAVRAWREDMDLTMAQAAALIYSNGRAWARWELGSQYESGRDMHPAFMELARIKHVLAVKGMTVDDLLAHLEALPPVTAP